MLTRFKPYNCIPHVLSNKRRPSVYFNDNLKNIYQSLILAFSMQSSLDLLNFFRNALVLKYHMSGVSNLMAKEQPLFIKTALTKCVCNVVYEQTYKCKVCHSINIQLVVRLIQKSSSASVGRVIGTAHLPK